MKIVKPSAIGLSILVFVLLGFFVGVPKLGDFKHTSQSAINKIRMKGVEGALELFRHDIGRYPSTDEGLSALIRNTGNIDNWHGPYLGGASVPRDPWDRPYSYHCPGKYSQYDLISFGRDGKEGGQGEDQDIRN
jgi:general secretion pathway protein G